MTKYDYNSPYISSLFFYSHKCRENIFDVFKPNKSQFWTNTVLPKMPSFRISGAKWHASSKVWFEYPNSSN